MLMGVQGALSGVIAGRRFFVTTTGRLGQASLGARVGDGIFVAVGAQLPFVVRETGTSVSGDAGAGSTYTFAGDCYLHGMMDGEAFEGGDAEEIGLV